MKVYQQALERIVHDGRLSDNRTGTKTIRYTGVQMRFNLGEGFPAVTTKKLFFSSVVRELLWFLGHGLDRKRSLNIKDLGCGIWDSWARPDGELGPIYSVQWLQWQTPHGTAINQLDEAIELIKNDPNSRRIIVSAWNPADLDEMALAPCHTLFQFLVNAGKLDCVLYQRSGDMFLGVPFNIASYALLTHMVASVCGLQVGTFVHNIADAHIYENHMPQVLEILARDPFPLPTLELEPARDIYSFKLKDISLSGYKHHPALRAEVAV